MTTPFDKFLDALEAGGSKVKRRGDKAKAQCLAHEDKVGSLSVRCGDDGRVLVRCFATCSLEAIAASVQWSVKDLFPAKEKGPRGKVARVPVTVASLAQAKKLPVEFLLSLGLRDEGDHVVIPYRNLDGVEVAIKDRTNLSAKAGSFWRGKGGLMAYGVDRLRDAQRRKELILVEGESDCWTLWYHAFPGLGIPGASALESVFPEYLRGIERLWVVQEPDQGGAGLIPALAKKLTEIGFAGSARVIRIVGSKDPNELHKKDPAAFVEAFTFALQTSVPLADAKPAKVEFARPEDEAEYSRTQDILRRRVYTCDDIGNAERFWVRHKDRTRWTAGHGWLVFDGRRWLRADSKQIETLAIRCVEDIPKEVPHADETQKEQLWKWAKKSRSLASMRAMTELAAAMPRMTLPGDAFDRVKHMITVANGSIDLRTGKLVPHNPEHLATRMTNVKYDPAATCPEWDRFVSQVMAGDEDLIAFLRRAVGYSLTGDCREECLFLNHGHGSNGKSTFLEVIRAVVGEYSASASFDTFMQKSNESIRNDIARLAGVRYVTASETESNARLSEATVKQVTGRDRLTARFLRMEHFEFDPQFKVWMSVNHLPSVRASDHGMWRRIRLIPWKVQFSPPDKQLRDRLMNELPGILAWAVQGAVEWHASGLRPPAAVVDETMKYRKDEDLIGTFIDEVADTYPSAEVEFSDLFVAFTLWCRDSQERLWTKKRFASAMTDKGYEKCEIGHSSAKGRKGLTLRREWYEKSKRAQNDTRTFQFGEETERFT